MCYSISIPNYYKDVKRIQQQSFTNEIMNLPDITRQTSNSFDKYDVSILHINVLQDILSYVRPVFTLNIITFIYVLGI